MPIPASLSRVTWQVDSSLSFFKRLKSKMQSVLESVPASHFVTPYKNICCAKYFKCIA